MTALSEHSKPKVFMQFTNKFIIAIILFTTCAPVTAMHAMRATRRLGRLMSPNMMLATYKTASAQAEQKEGLVRPALHTMKLQDRVPWLIELCQQSKTLGADGSFDSRDGRFARVKERDLGVLGALDELEVIQVGLKNKPVALFSYDPNSRSEKLGFTRQRALEFAVANSAIVKHYQDSNEKMAAIVYMPDHEKAANYFIKRSKAGSMSPADAFEVVLEGILLGYQMDNIKNYLTDLIEKTGLSQLFFGQMGLKEGHSEKDFDEAFSQLHQTAQDRAAQIYQE